MPGGELEIGSTAEPRWVDQQNEAAGLILQLALVNAMNEASVRIASMLKAKKLFIGKGGTIPDELARSMAEVAMEERRAEKRAMRPFTLTSGND